MIPSARPIGFGCLRVAELDEDAGVEVVRAALDAGATVLDTAGAYGDASDPHANERVVARALLGRDRAAVTVVSKGGLVRVGARFEADGRAGTLRAQCEASVEALGGPVDLYLLHAVDPRTPLATSVRALASLQRAGLVRRIGLSNVSLFELESARSLAEIAAVEIAAVEIALSPLDDEALRGGLVGRAAELGLLVLAHSPLGGPRRAARLGRLRALATIAKRHDVDAEAIAIAWLRDLSPAIVPIPGTRTSLRARSNTLAASLVLSDGDRAELDAALPAGTLLRTTRASRRPPEDAAGDVVILMGMQGSGKSTLAQGLEAAGYLRLNRDDRGGTLRALVPLLEAALIEGRTRVVLDNTYASRAARNEVIEAAWRHGVPVRCVLLDAPIEVAQANVARRMIERAGRLLEPGEIEAASKTEPAIIPPRALFNFRRAFEPPTVDEGFRSLEVRAFARRPTPGSGGVIVALDALLRSDGTLDEERVVAGIVGVFGWTPNVPVPPSLRVRLPDATIVTCAHAGGPPVCWCRPPLPGLVVLLLERLHLDPARCTLLGTHAHHESMARAVGVPYRDGKPRP